MALLEIIKYPDKFLKHTATPVAEINDEILQLIEDMAETMYDEPGVGLAATQVGRDERLFVYNISDNMEKCEYDVLINPEIISHEGVKVIEKEGCLSVPDYKANVKRFASVTVSGLNLKGESVRIEVQDMMAAVFQHEIDHLNGILFIEHISALKRDMYKRRIKKKLRKKAKKK
ncbi:peptide deformylase [Desulfococcaceae bacterium HSG9]|nr:peptide deformylase [Desulfococcaceae bacterium HSG9]